MLDLVQSAGWLITVVALVLSDLAQHRRIRLLENIVYGTPPKRRRAPDDDPDALMRDGW